MNSKELKQLFAKYMVTKDSKTAHAKLSASGSERWLGCPASPRLSEGMPQIEHESGPIGTNAHTLLQFILENPRWGLMLTHPASKKFRNFIGYCNEQLQAVLVAANYIVDERIRMKNQTGQAPQLHVEQKLKLDGVGFGTADTILYQPFGLLHVIDYKNGKYRVKAMNNTQGLYYAVAAADKFGWNFREVWITIIQPNAPGKASPITTWKTTPERLEKAKLMFQRGAKRTKDPNAPAIPDHKYCWFCPGRPKCPAQLRLSAEKVLPLFQR